MFRKIMALAIILVAITALPSLAEVYGNGVTNDDLTKISSISADSDSFVGKEVTIEGPVVGVCRSRGCWMELGSDKEFETLRIKVDDGVMVFPLSAMGKTARVQGKVERVYTKCNDKGEYKKDEGVFYQIRATGAVIN